jgi:hypothetical protein
MCGANTNLCVGCALMGGSRLCGEDTASPSSASWPHILTKAMAASAVTTVWLATVTSKRSDATNLQRPQEKVKQTSHLLSLHLTSKHCASLSARPAFQEAAHGKQQLTSALRHRQRRRRRCLCGPGAITHPGAAVSYSAAAMLSLASESKSCEKRPALCGQDRTWPTAQQLGVREQGCTTPTRQACCRVRVSHSECLSCVPLKTTTLYFLSALLEITPGAQLCHQSRTQLQDTPGNFSEATYVRPAFYCSRHGTELDVTAVITNTATGCVTQGVHLGEQH